MIILLISKHVASMQQSKLCAVTTQGFLLIELVIGLMFLIFFVYLVHCYQNLIIGTQYDAIKRIEATNISNSFIAQACVNPALLQQQRYSYQGCALTWNVENSMPFNFEKLPYKAPLTRFITLYAEWQGWNKKKYTMTFKAGIPTT